MYYLEKFDVEVFRYNLTQKLKTHNLSMRAASLKAGLSESYIKKTLKHRCVPTVDKIESIARVFECTIDDLTTTTNHTHSPSPDKNGENITHNKDGAVFEKDETVFEKGRKVLGKDKAVVNKNFDHREVQAAYNITQLGNKTSLPNSPDEALVEKVANPHPDTTYAIRFTCPEFTSLCPITGQPDFAHFIIDYIPDNFIIESKSLKLYMASFRNHAAFHESCTIDIAKRVIAEIEPKWLRICGYWYPRGGIPIDIFYQTGEPPKDIWIDDTGVTPYTGRG